MFLAVTDMKAQFVYDPLISKRQQFLLATQVCRSTRCCVTFTDSLSYSCAQVVRMILRIDDVVDASAFQDELE